MRLALDGGADVNAKDTENHNRMPLHYASSKGKKDICSLLIERGAAVNAKDDEGQTPLNWASYYGDKDVCALLIERGADVNTKDEDGWTPLHRASYLTRKGAVEILLDSGADVNAKTKSGKTPRDYANDIIREMIDRRLAEKRRLADIDDAAGSVFRKSQAYSDPESFLKEVIVRLGEKRPREVTREVTTIRGNIGYTFPRGYKEEEEEEDSDDSDW